MSAAVALFVEAVRALSRDVTMSSSIKSKTCLPAGRTACENNSFALIRNAVASLAIMSTVGDGLIVLAFLVSMPFLDRSKATTYG